MVGNKIKELFESQDIEIFTIGRSNSNNIQADLLVYTSEQLDNLIRTINPNYILNFVGKIKQNITNQMHSIEAIKLNSILPSVLDELTAQSKIGVITIATDCVFSGSTGRYLETAHKDGSDIYAITKILGETLSQNTMHLRTSVVGFGTTDKKSLFDWYTSLNPAVSCDGYYDHMWNGITNLAVARITLGIVKNNLFKAGVHHLIPENAINKYELLSELKNNIVRPTANIVQTISNKSIDRTLDTLDPEFNEELWRSAGYTFVPSINFLIKELVGNIS